MAWRGVDTGAKAEATCDPTGAWKLTYGEPSNNGFCTKPATPPWLQVKKAPSGKLLAEFAAVGSPVTIDATTCTIKASHSFTVSNPSESWTASTSATLKVSGDTATGNYTLSNLGFCKGMATGLLSATRE